MADDLAKLTKHEFPALTRELNRFVRTLYQTKIIKKSEIAVTQEKIRTEYFSHMYHLLKTFGDDLTDDALYLMMHIHLAVSLADTLPNGMPNEKRKEFVRDLLQFLGTEEFKKRWPKRTRKKVPRDEQLMAPPGVAILIFLRIAASIIFLIWFPLALLYVFSTNVDLCVISQC